MRRPDPRLSETTLPVMPHTARELRRLLRLDMGSNPQLLEALVDDPGAAVAVFRQLGRLRADANQRVGDVAHAVSMIGREAFTALIEGLPEVGLGDARGTLNAGPCGAYSQAAHAAYFAATLAGSRQLPATPELRTAALLKNTAIVALWAIQPDAAQRASYAVRDGVPAEQAYAAELGESLSEANRRLARAWSLPRLAQASDTDGLGGAQARVVQLAERLAQATSAGWQHPGAAQATAELADFLDISRDAANARLHEWAIDAARRLSRLHYPLPGFELAYMPGEVEDDDDDIPLMGSWRRKPPATQAAKTRPAAPDLQRTMAEVIRRIRDEAGAERVLFAMLNKDRSRLRTRLALGGRPDDGVRSLDLALNEKNLFTAMLGKSQSIWLNHANAARFRAYLPDSLARLLAPHGAYLMSLFVRQRPLGLLYADGARLDEQGYRQFRDLCTEAARALTSGSRERPGVAAANPQSPPS